MGRPIQNTVTLYVSKPTRSHNHNSVHVRPGSRSYATRAEVEARGQGTMSYGNPDPVDVGIQGELLPSSNIAVGVLAQAVKKRLKQVATGVKGLFRKMIK